MRRKKKKTIPFVIYLPLLTISQSEPPGSIGLLPIPWNMSCSHRLTSSGCSLTIPRGASLLAGARSALHPRVSPTLPGTAIVGSLHPGLPTRRALAPAASYCWPSERAVAVSYFPPAATVTGTVLSQ